MPKKSQIADRRDGTPPTAAVGSSPPADRATDTILELARSVLEELDLEVVLRRVLAASQALTGARYAALGVLDEGRAALARFITAGLDEPQREQIGSLPTGRGVLGELIAHPAPVRVPDVNAHPRSYGFPAGHPPMRSFLGVPILIRGLPFGNLYLTDKEGVEQFTAEDERSLVVLADLAGVAIDHARRFTSSEAQRGELQQIVAALDATTQISRALGGQTDLGEILKLVAKRGRALVSARTVLIELERGDELEVAAGAGELPDGILGQSLPLAGTVAAHALQTGQTQRLDDVANRARFEHHGLGQLGVGAGSGLVVPMIFHGRGHGVVVCVDRLDGGAAFSAQDQLLLESFASSAAVAVATARTVEADRRSQRLAVAEQEKARWARELHDETLQALGAMRLALAAALRVDDPAKMTEIVGDVVGHLDLEIAGLRSLITELRPAALDHLGPAAAIDGLAQRARAGGLRVDVVVDLAWEQGRSAERHATELETAVYRIVQESLTNAAKHGGADGVVVEVVEADGGVSVVVRDDGDGFDPAARTDGFGLLGMRERVDLLGGTLEVSSELGRGTTVTAMFPVAAA